MSESTAYVPAETARQLAEYQSQMVLYLKMLTSEERLEQSKTIIVQQALMTHAIDQLHQDLQTTSEKLEAAVTKLSSAMWSLLKVPVACVIVGAASWAFLYAHEISENTWLIIMGVAVFPWMGDSILAVMKLFGIRQPNVTQPNGTKQ